MLSQGGCSCKHCCLRGRVSDCITSGTSLLQLLMLKVHIAKHNAHHCCCCVHACVQGAHEPLCLELTQDLLVSGWRDGIIRAHDADSGALLWQIDNAHSGGVTALTLSGNQRFALTGNSSNRMLTTTVYCSHRTDYNRYVMSQLAKQCIVPYSSIQHVKTRTPMMRSTSVGGRYL
jgi:WD40 repeat protein